MWLYPEQPCIAKSQEYYYPEEGSDIRGKQAISSQSRKNSRKEFGKYCCGLTPSFSATSGG